jgi:hypothetical protein
MLVEPAGTPQFTGTLGVKWDPPKKVTKPQSKKLDAGGGSGCASALETKTMLVNRTKIKSFAFMPTPHL